MKWVTLIALSYPFSMTYNSFAADKVYERPSAYTKGAKSNRATISRQSRISARDTSRDKGYYWEPLPIPAGLNGYSFSTRVSNLNVTVIEQISPENNISTRYIATGTYFNLTQDDRGHTSSSWIIELSNSAGTTLDSFTFSLPRGHCSYSGEEPFRFEVTSRSNYFDIIAGAYATGIKPRAYEGGC